MMRGTYYRWSEDRQGNLYADILGTEMTLSAVPGIGEIWATVPNRALSPDEARMLGVRLIEAAALSDTGAVRRPEPPLAQAPPDGETESRSAPVNAVTDASAGSFFQADVVGK